MTWTNDTKHTTTFTNDPLGTQKLTWDEATFTWNAATGTWDNPYAFINDTKHSSSFTNDTKH